MSEIKCVTGSEPPGYYWIKIRVPGKLRTLNELLRMHYGTRDKYNKRQYDLVRICVGRHLPPEPLLKCKITATVFNNRMRDFDGFVGSLKPLIDGLAHAGVIKHDGYSVTGDWIVTQKHCKKGFNLTELTIESRI